MSTNLHTSDRTHKTLIRLLPVFFVFLLFFILPYFQKARVTVQLEVGEYDHIQVFWSVKKLIGGAEGYSQGKSIVQPLHQGPNESVFLVPSLKKIASLRIDPSNRATQLTLRSITVTQAGFSPLAITTWQEFDTLLKRYDAEVIDIGEKGVKLQSSRGDSQLELTIHSEFSYLQYFSDTVEEFSQVITQRMDLLGLDWSGFFFLGLDILILLSISVSANILFGIKAKDSVEFCIILGLTGLAVVVGTVVLCGMSYLLNWQNLLVSHIVIWFFIHALIVKGDYRRIFPESFLNFQQSLGTIFKSIRKMIFPSDRRMGNLVSAILMATILFLLFYYLIPAAFTLPLNFDSNDYRLSRVGYWLQESNIWQFPTNDIRQVIMPSNCDLSMLWITSFFKKGYPLVHLVSFFAGMLVCSSIYALCKRLYFTRQYSLIAVLIWLGIPNSASQMLTSQTDLYTTGCLMAGLYCVFQAVRQKNYFYYVYAGIGVGLSVGAKSTVFLWGPGLLCLCLAIILCRLKDLNWKLFGKGTGIAVLFVCMFGGFVYGQNFIRYGNFLGPSNVVGSIHDSRAPSVKEEGEARKPMSKLSFVSLRAQAYFWQIFEPSSNLGIIHPFTNAVFDSTEGRIYETNKTLQASFVSMFKAGASWLRASRLSEDYVSFGFVVFALMVLGGFVALGRTLWEKDPQSTAVTIMFVSVLLYMLFFCWIVGWTVHRYRYAILVTPFIAVIGMYFLATLWAVKPRFYHMLTVVLTASVILYQTAMSFNVAKNSRAHGWLSFRYPEKVYSYVFYWQDVRTLTNALAGKAHRLGLILSKGAWKSLFFRTGADIRSYIIPITNSIQVSNEFLQEHHIDALVTKNLSSINVVDNFNLIPSLVNVYQALIPVGKSEKPIAWIVPNGAWSDGWVKLHGEVRIGNWRDDSFSIELCNPAPVEEMLLLKSSLKEYKIIVEANSECKKVDIPVKDNDLISWRIQPGYHPWKMQDAKETRSLGMKMKFPKAE